MLITATHKMVKGAVAEGASESTREYKLWTKHEEKTLVMCMTELVEKNNIQRGNFRISGFKELERMLHSKVENCQLLAIPHIKSKVRYFKDKFSALLELKEASGFGWDDVRGCVVADDTVFAGWVKSHPKASGLNNKPLPYCDELCHIFGVDQALGADAVQPADAASKLEGEGQIYDMTDENSHYDSFSIPQSFDHNAVIEEIINQGIDLYATSLKEVEEISSRKMQPKGKGKEKATSSGSKRSRQTFSEEDRMHILENIALTAENITKIATNYCIEGDLAVKRQYLYGELSKFHELSVLERTRALRHLNRDDGDVTTFFQLPTDEEKLAFLRAVLE